MKLVASCKSCRKELKIKSFAATRPDLSMDKGDTFNLNCIDCGSNSEIHVNEVSAKENFTIIIAGIIVSVIVTVILWQVLGAIGTITIGIPMLMWGQQAKSVSAFNGYMLRR